MGERMALEVGRTYRVIKPGAQLTWMESIGPYTWTQRSINLAVGDVLTYEGQHNCWGSDPIPVAKFTKDKRYGEFEPSDWGHVPAGWLELVADTSAVSKEAGHG